MAILVANLGTSDLSVKVEGYDYFFPAKFNRSEPNDPEDSLSQEEEEFWRKDGTTSYISSFLCPDLKVSTSINEREKINYSFRELTEKLFQVYEQNPEKWHPLIKPCRIWGVIKTAVDKFNVKDVYLVLTDQPENEEKGRLDDTIHLFNILQKWLVYENIYVNLHPEIIKFKAVDDDRLFQYYYSLLSKPDINEPILASVKGGTPQMKTALKAQAISLGFSKLLFIDPKLKISSFLRGLPSETEITSFWKHARTQKYQSIKLLLERWDFGGALVILNDWRKNLKYLNEHINDSNLFNSNNTAASITKTLEIACNCLDLNVNRDTKLPQIISTQLKSQISSYDRLLNIYTQCQMYWELDHVANFLYRLSTFCELILHQVMHRNNGRFNDDSGNRFSKRNEITSLIKDRNREDWNQILQFLEKLDFWVDVRNQLVHSAQGVSKKSMQELHDSQPTRACPPRDILSVMKQILQARNGWLLKKPEYLHRFVDLERYYIYSDVREWIINKLMTEGLE
ncbi:hypothetical protein [Anthocerotibacter panamensis]|uniref:hypothetical protein n=1 Tax=Anthocerotibacter panamensis TaxID=2857077 RepID=UPI001C406C8D|nr:hypothetical protein [Anthocerotibacter panamensis]